MEFVSADVTANDDPSSIAQPSLERHRRSAQRAWLYSGILVPLVFAVLMFAVLVVALRTHRVRRDELMVVPGADERTGLLDAVENAHSDVSDEPDRSALDVNLAAINLELRRTAFEIELAKGKQALRHLQTAEAEWSKLLENTLNDTAGKRIAGNEHLLLRFIALRQLPAPPDGEHPVSQFAKQLNDVHKKATATDVDGDSLDHQTSRAAELNQQAFALYAFHRSRFDHLQTLRKSATSSPPSDLDLATAVSARAASLAVKVDAGAQAAARELEASLGNELREFKTERDNAAKVVADLTSQLSGLEKGELPKKPIDDDSAPISVSREDYEREIGQIRKHLVAFTTPGYVQPESADKLVYRDTKQPFSYSALQRIRALEDSDDARAILFRVGGLKSAGQQNDRPLGTFPRMNSISELPEPDVIPRLKEAQRLLRRYGQLMVEDGLLSP